MTLKDWLAKNEMSDAEFARISGIGQRALVQKYRHGRQFPGPENLRRIKEATNGRVTANDFFDQNLSAPPSAEPVEAA
jgi:transcriptional regulator with XRE-family HTH domain